jgi:hypothetical protein
MHMRALVSRKLSALGYSIGQKLKLRGVEAVCVRDPRGRSMLLVSNVFYGPSWVQIHKGLENMDPAPALITLGATPAVLIEDSIATREIIASLFDIAISLRGKQVLLDGIGFVDLDSKTKLDVKRLALPLVSVICVVGIGIYWDNSSVAIESLENVSDLKLCIVDSTSSEFQSWLLDSLRGETGLSLGKEIRKSTASGQINIVVESTLGSAAKVTGTASCDDGRERRINHRLDSSGAGAVLELGQ